MEKKNQPGSETPEIKTRIPLWLYPSTLEAVDRAMGRDNCKSRSEFIENAIRFYAGYLSGEDAVQFLPAALVSALRATVENSETRIARLLFKLAVEIGMMMHVLGAGDRQQPAGRPALAVRPGGEENQRRHLVQGHAEKARGRVTV